MLSPSAEVQGHSEDAARHGGRQDRRRHRAARAGRQLRRAYRVRRRPRHRPLCLGLSARARRERGGALAGLSPGSRRQGPVALSRTSLPGEQSALALDAASGSRTATPSDLDHAVAGDRHGDAVRGAGASHRAHRFRRADRLGDVRVARGRARRNAAERLPHAMLKGGALDVEGKVEIGARVLDEGDDPGGEPLERLVAADQTRAGELILEVAEQGSRVVAEKDGAYALVARSDENGAERALADGEFDRGIRAARLEIGRRHAEHLGRGGVEAAIRIETGIVDRRRDRGALAKLVAHALVAMSGGVGLGRHAEHRLEDAMEVIGAQADRRGEVVELRRFCRPSRSGGRRLSPSRRVGRRATAPPACSACTAGSPLAPRLARCRESGHERGWGAWRAQDGRQ